MIIPRLLALLASTVLMAHALKSQEKIKPPTDAEIKEQVARLDNWNATSERLEAIKWIRAKAVSTDMRLAIPALEKCILAELEAKVRVDSIACLAFICRKLKEPCPLFIVELLLDKDENVSGMADVAVMICAKFPEGSLEVFLKCARSTDPSVRSRCLAHIALAGGKNKEALEAIEHATKDKDFGVRHNAQVAIFQAKGDLERFLTYLVRRQEDPKGLLGPVDLSTEAGKRELERATNVVDHPATWLIPKWSDERPDDLVATLLKLLSDPSPPMRRGASKLLGISAVKVEFETVGGMLKQKQPSKVEPSRAMAAMEKSGAEDRLRNLSEKDMDETVRKAAGDALKLIHSVKGK